MDFGGASSREACFGQSVGYYTKFLSNGEVERLKSRLVILGNHQEADIDYIETLLLSLK